MDIGYLGRCSEVAMGKRYWAWLSRGVGVYSLLAHDLETIEFGVLYMSVLDICFIV